MKKKGMRTLWTVIVCILAVLILTAAVHVYVYLYGYPVAQIRPGVFLPKAILFLAAAGALMFSMHRGRRAPRRPEESGRLGS